VRHQEYYGDIDSYLSRFNVFYHEALGGKYDAENLDNNTREQKLCQRPL
jgi:hypothetical protein